MNYIKISKCDIANGPGIRVVLWCSGCDIRCKGCHNPESWDYAAGGVFTEATMNEIIGVLNLPYIRGLTLSGGHPLAPGNIDCVHDVISRVRREFPDKDIWLYTGYALRDSNFVEEHCCGHSNHDLTNKVIRMCDVVVDGEYIENQRDITLRFRGSSNQRLIDVKRTIESGCIITITD